ncbi:hypothetical protein OUHCRE11_47320 [Enterobacter asburiae]
MASDLPINSALIPNWKSSDPRVVKGEWFNVGGKVYGTQVGS